MYRPEPIPATDVVPTIDCKSDWNTSAKVLAAGDRLLVVDLYSTGLNTLAALRRRLKARHPDTQDYGRSRELRAEFQQASQNLLAPVAAHRLALNKAPEIGWLDELYADTADFLLPFPQVQGLNSAWQWYQKGIEIPVLNRRLYPFYGTYFPTRFAHLELLESWLHTYEGPRRLAWDVGTGCGVLALQLLQAGFARVKATDKNPNAVESVRRELDRQAPAGVLQVAEADLFGSDEEQAELVLFNPPWLRGVARNPIDEAIYYQDGLLSGFFDQAHRRVTAQGRVVLLFSNLQQTADASVPHPIEQELASNGRFILVDRQQRSAQAASSKTRRRKRDAATELVELWELAPTTT